MRVPLIGVGLILGVLIFGFCAVAQNQEPIGGLEINTDPALSHVGTEAEVQPACAQTNCLGLTYLAPPRSRVDKAGHITFTLATEDALSDAFGALVVDLVGSNLLGIAHVETSTTTLDPFAALGANLSEQADALGLAAGTRGEEADLLPPLAPRALEPLRWELSSPQEVQRMQVDGKLTLQNAQVMEITLRIASEAVDDQNPLRLLLRADMTDWRRVAHYVSDTLFTLMTDESSLFDSQIAFVAHSLGHEGVRARLALIDQGGGGLTLVEDAGVAVAHPIFLGNRFELAYLDQSEGHNALMHLNRLTGRFTPLVLLPDLIGAPTLGQGGRYIAFAGLETGQGPSQGHDPATDVLIVDVEAGHVQPITIPGSVDRDPSFSHDLSAVSFVSAQADGSELIVARFSAPLGQRDRTQGQTAAQSLSPEVTSLYTSSRPLRQPTWSPDDRALAFIEDGAQEDHLLVYDFATKEIDRLASGPNLSDPTWGPKAGFLALIVEAPASGPGTLLRLDLHRGLAQILPVPLRATAPSWSPTSALADR